MTARQSAVFAAFGLVTFGSVIGLMTGLSDTKGTVATLFGLLFALVGGSFAALFKDKEVPPDRRRGMMHATGLVSLGIMVGLFGAFGLRVWDEQRRAFVVAGVPKSQPTTGSVVRLHGALTTEQQRFAAELGSALGRTDLKDEDRKDLQALADGMNGLVAGVERVEGMIGRNPDAVSDRFKASFRNAFPAADPSPKQ